MIRLPVAASLDDPGSARTTGGPALCRPRS